MGKVTNYVLTMLLNFLLQIYVFVNNNLIEFIIFFYRSQLDRHESNIDLLEHRLEKVNIK